MSVGLLSGRDAQTVLLCRKLGWTGQAERIIRMEQRILQYRKFMDEELLRLSKEQNVTEEEISRIKKEHLVQISLFQHERLVHLIVTVTFALLEMLAILLTVVSRELFPILLSGALLILLIPYVRHYYILENEVQKMYGQYDALCSLSMGNTAFRQRKL
ncbi:hypothetical protein OCV77_06565 [Suilimivivens aceti]|uniref:Uncharacterized protein n=1 Tax=Suilimivivens aceti TaxID=2981774 RepID=A0ABT2T1N2_9FIRM|nr:hypothetical protein [Suilimivivens aceti]MCU6744158.1 hypothetical protein [Suilimivivens aceti]SCH56941.1 Uncharacterised protein [uncultured Clostridium sp.]